LAETNAETAETGAVAAQLAAESARDSALAAYDNFDDRYLGAKTADPTLDNDGDALVAGALYFNSVDGAMRVYTGSVWVDAYAAGQTFLAKVNNLSDLPNVATARQNLDLEIGVDVQAYDATILKSADIGVTVQGYDADTAKYDDATANFTGTLQNGGSNVLVDTDIGSTVQAYDATIVVDADIGVTVQGYDADTAKYDDATANFTGTLQNGGSNVLVDSDIGSTVQTYDSNLTSFVSTFTLPTTDGTADQVLKTNGSGTLSFVTPAAAIADGDKGDITVSSSGAAWTIDNGAVTSSKLGTDLTITAAAGSASTPSITTTGDTNTGIFFPAADTIAFAEGGAEAMRIDSSGNVGIGTTSAINAFSYTKWLGLNAGISGDSTAAIDMRGSRTVDGGFADINFFHQSTSNRAYIQARRGSTDSETNIAFGTNNTERARITSGGVLLVGSTAQLINESAFGANSSGNTSTFKTSAGANGWCSLMWNSATSGNNTFVEFLTETVSTARGSVDYNRTGGLTRYNTTSDATLKNILGDSDGAKSVEILNSTRIREYAWKDDETQKPQIGVIAQELYETYKGAVSVGGDYEVTIPAVTEQRLVSEAVLDEDGNEIEAAVYETVETEPERTETKYRPWGVDKTAFTFHLVAGWQAHEKLIKQQAETIAALEARIAALEQA
jgi:hypothetical protein